MSAPAVRRPRAPDRILGADGPARSRASVRAPAVRDAPHPMSSPAPTAADAAASFADLGLPTPLLEALTGLGYDTPTPVQASTIPPLLAGRDLVGHAPTGTGKTAAFALPLIARLAAGTSNREPVDAGDGTAPDVPAARGAVRVLVLTPTRELAMQVAAAFERYAAKLGGVKTLAIYGGQEYGNQIRQLARGVQVVVGTPGRVMDHMRRGTLVLDGLEALVLDEGDEMLRMGFIDDVEWVLEQTPKTRQVALFSATMPPQVRRIAQRHLKKPEEISIQGSSSTAATIRQRVWMVNAPQKLDALTRILEVEPFDAILIFVRTKSATVELAEKLQILGHSAAAINGDMAQKQREQMVERLKKDRLDILVATDVVARGLDVDRISLVINYDVPYDTEAYVHRIGRTGRAGRTGEAILFVTPRERGLLGAIERATRQKIEPLAMPTVEEVNAKRVGDFLGRIDAVLEREDLGFLERMLGDWQSERQVKPERLAAALAHLAIGDAPFLLAENPREARKAVERERGKRREPRPDPSAATAPARAPSSTTSRPPERASAPARVPERPAAAPTASTGAERPAASNAPSASRAAPPPPSSAADVEGRAAAARRDASATPAKGGIEMERFRVEVGTAHGVETRNLVGAIASEADIDSSWIGKIDVRDDHSVVELPVGMPKFLLKQLRRVWVCGQRLDIARLAGSGEPRQPASAERSAAGRAGPDAAAPTPRERAPGPKRSTKPGKPARPGPGGVPRTGPKGAKAPPARGGDRPPKRSDSRAPKRSPKAARVDG